jgi:hypothetical protein
MSLALLAAVPGMAMAGSLNSLQLKNSRSIRPKVAPPPQKTQSKINQELADKVAKVLEKAKFRSFEIEVDVREGLVTLDGVVTTPGDKAEAAKICGTVAGVTAVSNRLRIADLPSKSAVQQTGSRAPTFRERWFPIRQTGAAQQKPVTRGQSPIAESVPYDQAAYLGGAYGAQAAQPWPYLGPFYPYPQAHLGWKRASMVWDGGLWSLNVTPNHCKSGWWLDPHNW